MDHASHRKTHDSLGRRFANQNYDDGKPFTLAAANFAQLEALNRHGRLPTPHLVGHGLQTGVSDALYQAKRLGWMARRANTPHGSPYVFRPSEQFPNLPNAFIPGNLTVVYDLAPAGVAALKERGTYVPITHKGWHDHQLMTACITSSIDLASHKAGIGYLPRHKLISEEQFGAKVPFSYTRTNRKGQKQTSRYELRLVPDQLFALQYETGQRWFALEADRGTEPLDEVYADRKTILRSILQYQQFIGAGQLYKTQYFARAPLLVLFIVPTQSRAEAILSLVERVTGGCNYILVKVAPEFAGKGFTPPKPNAELFGGPWRRAGREDLYICR